MPNSNIVHWSPEPATQPTQLGAGEHYLRLGAYVPVVEPADADISYGGHAQGIFFYTSGIFSLKATKDWHQTVNGPVKRTIKTKDFEYTNETGDVSITVSSGKVDITAKEDIVFESAQSTPNDTDNTITIEANSNNVYFIQGKYEKVTDKDHKIITGANHKTNIGVYLTTCSGANTTVSAAVDLSYSTFSVFTTGMEITAKGLALGLEQTKNTLTFTFAFTLSYLEAKKVYLDEELAWVKNETRAFRYVGTLSDFRSNQALLQQIVDNKADFKAAEAHFKALTELCS